MAVAVRSRQVFIGTPMGDHRGYDRDPISDNGIISIIVMLFVIAAAATYIFFEGQSDEVSEGTDTSVQGSPIQRLRDPPATAE